MNHRQKQSWGQRYGAGRHFNKKLYNDFLKKNLDNYLHKHQETADILIKKILESEKERKEISGIQKLARERAKKVSLHNRNSGTAGYISTPPQREDLKAPCLLPKAILQAVPLQHRATYRLRLSSALKENLLMYMALQRK